MRTFIGRSLTAAAALATLAALTAPVAGAQSRPLADLRVDANRDGVASDGSDADERGEERVDAGAGAIVLPNLDDDERRCRTVDGAGRPLPDLALDDCHDAADERVNGARDARDLAPLRVVASPQAPPEAAGVLSVAPAGRLRLFVRRAGTLEPVGADGRLTAGELRSGVALAAEATDVVRNRRAWDGTVTVTLSVGTASDRVRLRVAPLVVHPETTEPLRFFTMPLRPDRRGAPETNLKAGADLGEGLRLDDSPQTLRALDAFGTLPLRGSRQFQQGVRRGLRTAGRLDRLDVLGNRSQDEAMQDVMEAASVSMPARGGRRQTIQVAIRSANVERPEYESPLGPFSDYPLREGGRVVFERLRGPDVAGVQQVDLKRARLARVDPLDVDGKSSGGNWTATPPTPRAPGGAVIYGGRGEELPDAAWTRMIADQGVQKLLRVDTTWLSVGHVDEFFNMLPGRRPGSVKLAVASPRLGYALLRRLERRGAAGARLFEGRRELRFVRSPSSANRVGVRVPPAARTVSSLLRSRRLRSANAFAQRRIDASVRRLRRTLGIARAEVVKLPVLYRYSTLGAGGGARVTSLLPNVVNGQHAGGGVFLAPRQHGPRLGGRDLFQQVTQQRLRQAGGLRVAWVEDWYFSHDWSGLGGGDVHCTTNAFRDLSTLPAPWTVRQEARR